MICRWKSQQNFELYGSGYLQAEYFFALSNPEIRWALCFHQPLVYILYFNLFRVIGLIIGGLILFSVAQLTSGLDRYGVSRHRLYRHSTFTKCGINQSFVSLRSGDCELEPELAANENGLLQFKTLVDVSGYYLRNLPRSCPMDSFHFEIQGLDEDENRWVTVVSCAYRYTQLGIRFLPGKCSPANSLSVDHRAPWPLKLLPAAEAVIGSCFLATSLCAWNNALRHTERLFQAALVLAAAIYAASALGFAASDTPLESVLYFLYALLCFLAAAVLRWAGSLAAPAALITGVAGMLARVAADCGCFADCSYLADSPPFYHVALSLCGLLFLLTQRRSAALAIRGATADRAAYDAEWQRVAAGPEQAELDRLADVADGIAAACDGQAARHTRRAGTESLVLRLPEGPHPSASADSMGSDELAVSSLSQLYSQAAGVSGMLSERAGAWARRTGGVTRSQGESEEAAAGQEMNLSGSLDSGRNGFNGLGGSDLRGEEWDPLLELPEVAGLVRRGCVKRLRRAWGKLAGRAELGRDASRLVDLCRERIRC